MINKKEVAQAIWNTYLEGYSKALMTPVEQFDTTSIDSKKIIADVLREVVNQFDDWGGDEPSCCVFREIADIIDELENL